MKKSEVFPSYRKCVDDFSTFNRVLFNSYEKDSLVKLKELRGYTNSYPIDALSAFDCGFSTLGYTDLVDYDDSLGLKTVSGDFLLNDRFIIPLKDISGSVVSYVGWYPDTKKYITVPSPFFSKSVMFFNYSRALSRSWENFQGTVILVEGMFDCISLDAIGLPVIATMGITVTDAKKDLLLFFNKVLALSDNDKAGRRTLDPSNSKYYWRLPSNATRIKMTGGEIKNEDGVVVKTVKDADDLVNLYEPETVIECLLQFESSRRQVETLVL